jgi:hypothetical protein
VCIITITGFEWLNYKTFYTKPYQDSPLYNGTKRASNINKRKKSILNQAESIFCEYLYSTHNIPFLQSNQLSTLTHSRANTGPQIIYKHWAVDTKLVDFDLCSTPRITYDYPQIYTSYSLEHRSYITFGVSVAQNNT